MTLYETVSDGPFVDPGKFFDLLFLACFLTWEGK